MTVPSDQEVVIGPTPTWHETMYGSIAAPSAAPVTSADTGGAPPCWLAPEVLTGGEGGGALTSVAEASVGDAGGVVGTAVGAVVSGMPHAVTVIATAHMTTPTKVFTAHYTVFPSSRVTGSPAVFPYPAPIRSRQ